MTRLFAAHPEAIARTISIARRAAGFSLDDLRYEYPTEICPAGKTPMSHLRTLTWAGAQERSFTLRPCPRGPSEGAQQCH